MPVFLLLPATRGGGASAGVGPRASADVGAAASAGLGTAAGAGAGVSASALGGGGFDALVCILCVSEARRNLSLTSSNALLASGVAGDTASVDELAESFPNGQKSGNPALISPAGRNTRAPIFGPRLLGMPSNTEKYRELLRS